jgi:hypothetical protein
MMPNKVGQSDIISIFLLKKNSVPRGRQSSDLLMRLVAVLVSRPSTKSRFEIPFVSDQHRYKNLLS